MKVSCMVMAASEEEEPSLPDALTRVAQPRCLRSEKHACSPVLLTQTQQGHCAVTLRAGLGPPGLDPPFILLASSETEKLTTPLLSKAPPRILLSAITPLSREVLHIRLVLFAEPRKVP